MGDSYFDKEPNAGSIDFDGYKQRLLAHRYDYRSVNRIMHDVEQCADLTLDEYLELCDIANWRDLQ